MKFAVITLASILVAPAFAQEVPNKLTPPPEGFYRNINGVYDLLARPYSFSEIRRVEDRRLPRVLERHAVATELLAAPLPPPCELPPTANKPTRPSPCPSTR